MCIPTFLPGEAFCRKKVELSAARKGFRALAVKACKDLAMHDAIPDACLLSKPAACNGSLYVEVTTNEPREARQRELPQQPGRGDATAKQRARKRSQA